MRIEGHFLVCPYAIISAFNRWVNRLASFMNNQSLNHLCERQCRSFVGITDGGYGRAPLFLMFFLRLDAGYLFNACFLFGHRSLRAQSVLGPAMHRSLTQCRARTTSSKTVKSLNNPCTVFAIIMSSRHLEAPSPATTAISSQFPLASKDSWILNHNMGLKSAAEYSTHAYLTFYLTLSRSCIFSPLTEADAPEILVGILSLIRQFAWGLG